MSLRSCMLQPLEIAYNTNITEQVEYTHTIVKVVECFATSEHGDENAKIALIKISTTLLGHVSMSWSKYIPSQAYLKYHPG